MKCLITGSQGFVGKNLISRLSALGYELVCITSTSPVNSELPKGARFIHLPLNNINNETLEGVDTLIHLASAGVDQNASVDLQSVFDCNVTHSYNLILKALQCGVKRIIYMSSCFEYGLTAIHNKSGLGIHDALLPQTQYAATKAALTTLLLPLCNYFSAEICIVRAYNLYGDHEGQHRLYPSVMKAIRAKKVVSITHGSQIKYFTPIASLVNFIVDRLTVPPVSYRATIENLKGGKAMSVYSFVKHLCEEAGLDPIVHIKRELPSRANEPQVLIPDENSWLEINGEPI